MKNIYIQNFKMDKRYLKKQENDKRYLWKIDKTTKKYKKYLERRKKSMAMAAWRRLDEHNKKTPIEYKNRKNK